MYSVISQWFLTPPNIYIMSFKMSYVQGNISGGPNIYIMSFGICYVQGNVPGGVTYYIRKVKDTLDNIKR